MFQIGGYLLRSQQLIEIEIFVGPSEFPQLQAVPPNLKMFPYTFCQGGKGFLREAVKPLFYYS